MSENQEQNRETRIKQQKSLFLKRVVICLVLVLVFSVIFWAINKNAHFLFIFHML